MGPFFLVCHDVGEEHLTHQRKDSLSRCWAELCASKSLHGVFHDEIVQAFRTSNPPT